MRYFLCCARELFFLAGVWSPAVPSDEDESISAFAGANSPYWSTRKDYKTGILVEGHLSQYGPNYLFRTAVAARAIQEKKELGIDVVVNGFSHQWLAAKRAFGSFGVDAWVCLGNYFFLSNFAFFIFSRVLALWYVIRLKTPEDILKITLNGIKVGDLIYDDVIRNTKRKTVAGIDWAVVVSIGNCLFYYFQYRRLFRRRHYQYYVATHTAYSEYGLLCRVALMHGVKVIETSDIQMSYYEQISNTQLPTYHDGINNSIAVGLNKQQAEYDELRTTARCSLQERLDSKVSQIDAQKAYCGKVYGKEELRQTLDLPPGHKMVFVLAHVFSDSPHLSSAMLHADYYQWLATTLAICARATKVSWLIKPHPSAGLYGESGIIEKMVTDLDVGHVVICPADMNTKSLSVCADALVTVHGTAGLEYSCLGIPVFLAGRPFYAGFGFAIEPKTKEEYETILMEINSIMPLSTSQIDKALLVYAIWDQQFDWHNPIITSDVLANVWGSGVPRDLTKAYRLLTENLRLNDPRKLKLWEFVQSVVN